LNIGRDAENPDPRRKVYPSSVRQNRDFEPLLA
jgi:hypothetical protein